MNKLPKDGDKIKMESTMITTLFNCLFSILDTKVHTILYFINETFNFIKQKIIISPFKKTQLINNQQTYNRFFFSERIN